MNRRQLLSTAAASFTAASLTSLLNPTQPVMAQAADQTSSRARNRSNVKITDVRCILTAPARIRLAVIKVETNQPGLYGLGCGTFTQRIRPFDIEDVWQSSFVSSYWRNGPVLNNAISGVDMALWDILGKETSTPVYQLFGGKVRQAVDVYRHASGDSFESIERQIRGYLDEGYRHVRAQIAVPGLSGTYGARGNAGADAEVPANQRTRVWEPAPYVRLVPQLFQHLRETLGEEVHLLHDIHERVPPILAIQLAKDLEPYRLFFLEDPFSPEDIGWFRNLRAQTSTAISMGELFNSPHEWQPLVVERLIDFIRVHMSQLGGLSYCKKMAHMCEFFGVRTAWHGPGDVSPVGHAANVHLDLAIPNFGIQEARNFTQNEQDVFPGCPTLADGYYHVTDAPGLGIDMDETLAARFPINDDPPFDLQWGNLRRQDGTIQKP